MWERRHMWHGLLYSIIWQPSFLFPLNTMTMSWCCCFYDITLLCMQKIASLSSLFSIERQFFFSIHINFYRCRLLAFSSCTKAKELQFVSTIVHINVRVCWHKYKLTSFIELFNIRLFRCKIFANHFLCAWLSK